MKYAAHPGLTSSLAVCRRLARDVRAVSMVEFALCLPILIMFTAWLFELTNYAMVRQQVSQLALQVADNASRIGDQGYLQNKPINEGMINDLFSGAELQAGALDIAHNGRIILSSLEVDSTDPGRQYIHWQRCDGALTHDSTYGNQGDTVTGMGPANAQVIAGQTAPVMFVEIGYKYRPLISATWAPGTEFTEVAALIVRDSRDTSGAGIYPKAGQAAATC